MTQAATKPKKRINRWIQKRKAESAARLTKARRANVPEFKSRIQSYLDNDVSDTTEPLRCYNLQHYIRYFEAAHNIVESAYRDCGTCVECLLMKMLRARDSDVAVLNSWGGQCRLTITSSDKEYAAIRRKINRADCKEYFRVQMTDDHKAVLAHPDSGIGVLYDTRESSLELIDMIYSQLTDPSLGGKITTSATLNRSKSRDVSLARTTVVPTQASGTSNPALLEGTSTETPQTPQITKTGSCKGAVASMNPDDFVHDDTIPRVASMNPDDFVDDGWQDPTQMTEEELYTSRMMQHDTPYSELPTDVRRALHSGRTTKWGKCPRGYMEMAKKYGARYFIIRGKQWTRVPPENYKKFRTAVENYKLERQK